MIVTMLLPLLLLSSQLAGSYGRAYDRELDWFSREEFPYPVYRPSPFLTNLRNWAAGDWHTFDDLFGFPSGVPPYVPYNRRNDNTEVVREKDKVKVTLDMRHFKPEEITASIEGNYIIVKGNHEEKKDEHDLVSRQFTRSYRIPENIDTKSIRSELSSDNQLTIEWPLPIKVDNERKLEIKLTRKPAPGDDNQPKEPQVEQAEEKQKKNQPTLVSENKEEIKEKEHENTENEDTNEVTVTENVLPTTQAPQVQYLNRK